MCVRAVPTCLQAARTSFPFPYNTLMAVPGVNGATLRDDATTALRMIRECSLHSSEYLLSATNTSDVREEVHFRQVDKHGYGSCIMCGHHHSEGEGRWHRFDLVTGALLN